MTDIQGVLEGEVGRISPLVQLVYNVSGGHQATTIGITFFFLVLGFLVGGPGCVAASSRVIWSFAREGGLPEVFARVNKRQEVPLNALVLTWACICALSLIYIGNTTAFYGLSSGVTVVMIFSYAMPIFLRLIYGLKNAVVPLGPFQLGKWGVPINMFAACWCTYLTIFLCFPTMMPANKENMNYSALIFGACLLMAGGTWLLYGRRSYLGVLHQIDMPIDGVGTGSPVGRMETKSVDGDHEEHEKTS